ncbi:MAG: peptidylprolyl isomerase [Acidobacteriota bacterium]
MRGHRALLLLVALAVLFGCPIGGPQPAPDLAARIDDEAVRYREFELYLEELLGESGSSLESTVLSRLFDGFLEERLLVKLAVDRVLVPQGAAPRQAVERLLAEDPPRVPGEEAVEAYYQAHREDFVRPERVRLRQILVAERETAEEALRRLGRGEDFGAVAQGLSGDLNASSGGFQGELARDELPPAFAAPIFALEPGEVSAIIEAEYGFHLFQVVARLPAEEVSQAAVRSEIERRLLQAATAERVAQLAAEARNRYTLEVFVRNLPFNYQSSSRDES